MRILLCSHTFSPNVGGIETVGRLLAAEFVRAGHEVKVFTRTPGELGDDLGLHISRNPTRTEFRADVAWADVVLHNNISLPWALPLIMKRKPWVCANHNWPSEEDGTIDWKGRLKLWVSALATVQISVSRALSAELRGNSIVVGNPYDDELFQPIPEVVRDRDIILIGRLIPSKGVDTLIRAVALIRPNRPQISLTIVGDGPIVDDLRSLACEVGLIENVNFTGTKSGRDLVVEMSRHTLSVVPSRSRETFGIVALEAMACGCVVIGSDHGGVPEAVGKDGPIFPTDDAGSLAALVSDFLTTRAAVDAQLLRQAAHLESFSAHQVARRYLQILRAAGKPRGAQDPARPR